MTDLAIIWHAETAARAARADAATASGKATAAQAERDAHLCALVARAIASNFTVPALHLPVDTINDYADAVDILNAIVLRAKTEQRPETRALGSIAVHLGLATFQCLGPIWLAHRWRDGAAAAPVPTGWRAPLAIKVAA